MPWDVKDAREFTKKAKSPKSKRAWAHAANSVLEATGDEGRAVRAGNVAAKRSAAKSKR